MKSAKEFATDKPMKLKKRKFDMDNFHFWLLVIIPVLAVVLFCYVPMGGIIIAFKDYNYRDGVFGSPWIGFENFKFMLTTPTFARIAKNTIFMNLLMISVGTLCSVIVALLLFQCNHNVHMYMFLHQFLYMLVQL